MSPDDEQLRAEVLAPIKSPDLHRLYDYWQERRRDGRLPARADIDPLDLHYLLGNLLLVDVLRAPLRFRYRLTGTNLVGRLPFDMTGKMVDEHPDAEFRRVALSVYTQVATTGHPVGARRDVRIDHRLRRYDVLHLPLAADGAIVDMILVGMRDLAHGPRRG